MELRGDVEKKIWKLEISEEEKLKFIFQHRKNQEKDRKRDKDRKEEAKRLGLIP